MKTGYISEEKLRDFGVNLGIKAASTGSKTGCLICSTDECKKFALAFLKEKLTSEQLFALDIIMPVCLDFNRMEIRHNNTCISFTDFLGYIQKVVRPFSSDKDASIFLNERGFRDDS